MSLFIVDVESDGPSPANYSMICLGAIRVDRDLVKAPTFYGQIRPHSGKKYIPEALAVSGFSHEETLAFPRGSETMKDFLEWVQKNNLKGRPIFVSDNPAFDFQWVSYYFDFYSLVNPFGHSARRIGDFYAGLKRDFGDHSSWKSLRQTTHTHNPVDDARGNAEALLQIAKLHGPCALDRFFG